MNLFCPHCERVTPTTNVTATLVYEIKGTEISFEAPLVRCSECENEFENAETDVDVADMALMAYRKKTGLLSPEEIREFRKSLGLTQQELGKILGWGGATLSRYENGALQDEAHDRALRMIMRPDSLLDFLKRNPTTLDPAKHDELVSKLQSRENTESAFRTFSQRYLTDYEAGISSGYRSFDARKFAAMILHFCRGDGVSKTKLNKLLWYADFLFFKRNTVSISGVRYAHLPYGPCPDNYDLHLAQLTGIEGSLTAFEEVQGQYAWEALRSTNEPDYSVFSNAELHTLTEVAECFADVPANRLSDISHAEVGYEATSNGDIISYEFADELNWPK